MWYQNEKYLILSNSQTLWRQIVQLKAVCHRSVYWMSLLGTFLALMSCSYRSAAPESPAPHSASSQGVEKSFFFETAVDKKTGRTVQQPRTFLCGWATETGIGSFGEANLTQNVPMADHCNMIFEIEEKQLIGKMINPSFPDTPGKWETIVTIPIVSHYYLEKEKDPRGRETNNTIENDQRSHWTARPNIKLNLQGIKIFKWAYTLFFGQTGEVLAVEDIEWDKSQPFLGFTVTAAGSPMSRYQGGPTDSSFQGKFRFNFLSFNHNPDFKRTPFAYSNYRYMNILHIMGKKINGDEDVLSAAHWDLSKRHEVYLQSFPAAFEKIGEQVIADWNEALIEVGALNAQDLKSGKAGFFANKTQLKHPFDLRKTSMVWISDERVSEHSPLGIAMAHADVRNGEILWGGITLYGGKLEQYLKGWSANSSSTIAGQGSAVGSMARMFSGKLKTKEFGSPDSLKDMSIFNRTFSNENLTEIATSINLNLQNYSQEMHKKDASKAANDVRQDLLKRAALQNVNSTGISPSFISKMYEGARASLPDLAARFRPTFSSEDMKMQLFPSFYKQMEEADGKLEKSMGATAPTVAQLRKQLERKSGNIACLDRTFKDVGPDLAVAAGQSKKSFDEIMNHIVTELISHEYGHFLGVGHQFKENIVPADGSMPEKYIRPLKEKATEKMGFTNYSSVMGYRHAITEMKDGDPVKPGPQDKLILHYLYKQEYATFKVGDEDFKFVKMQESGIIPEVADENEGRKPSYFPQCNDTDASLGLDPYCNRFDVGNTASQIMQSYFEIFDANLIQNLFAMTDSRKLRPEYAEGYLWNRAFNNFGRVRVFYDYMRYKYRKEINKFRDQEEAIYEFSSACQMSDEEMEKNVVNKDLKEIFKKNPELKELCKANAFALGKFKDFVNIKATDFTVFNRESRFSSGGITGGEAQGDWSRIDGNWVEMTAVPLKMSALYALTSPVPWVGMGGWNLPIFTYDDPNMKYAYSSLYPQEFTRIMTANVQSNLKFATLGQEERTLLGQSVLSMLYFSYMEQMNNDASLFPERHIQRIRNQTKFDFSYVAIILDGKAGTKKNDPNRVARFTGSVYDFNTNRTSPINDVYLMPGGQVLARAENTFLLPLTNLRLLDDKVGYVMAFRANFDPGHEDTLEKISVKSGLRTLHDDVLNACFNGVEGKSNGLSLFFNLSEEKFKGFYMPVGTASDGEKTKQFLDSITENFKIYKDSELKPDERVCREALRGLSLIVSTAAVVNGYTIGPISDLIQK